MWFGTYSGLIHFNSKDSISTRVTAKGEDLKQINLENTRDYIVYDGDLWIGTSSSGIMMVNLTTKDVRFLDKKTNIKGSLIDSRVYTINIDPMSNIWISTRSGNLSVFSPITEKFQIHEWEIMDLEYSNRSEQMTPLNQMLVRPSGEVLLSHLHGLKIYSPLKRKIVGDLIPGNLTKLDKNWSSVKSFSENGDKIVMSYNLGPTTYYKERKELKIFDFLHRTYQVLFRYDTIQKRNLFFQGNNEITNIYERLNNDDTLTKIDLLDEGVGFSDDFSLILKSGNWLISASHNRFIIYNPNTTDYNLYSPSQSKYFFPDSTITTAYLNSDNSILFGTSKGLYEFNELTGEYTFLNSEIGLNENTRVYGIIRDKKNNLWIALNKELVYWNEKEKKTIKYGKKTGLDIGEFLNEKVQMDSVGNLYFATQNGILIVDPYSINLKKSELILSLSNLIINDSLQTTLRKNDFLKKIIYLNMKITF